MADKESNELLPVTGDKELGFVVFRILEDILKDKDQLGLPRKWQRNYELSRNKHWKGSGGAKIQLVSANLLHDHRTKTVNMLTDNNPIFNVVLVGAPGEFDEQSQLDLLHITEYWWDEQEQQSVLEKSVTTGEIYGCTVEKVVFNPDLEYGIGEVETELVDPYHFGFYPVKAKDIQKAEAVLHFYPMSVREARRLWPDVYDKIQADSSYIKELQDTRRELAGGGLSGLSGGYFSTFKNVVKQMFNSSGKANDDGDETLVVECWVKDYSTDKDGNPLYAGNIRCVTVCNGGSVVLSDRSNPSINPLLPDEQAQKTWLYDKFPFSLTPSITDPLIPWGMSDYEQLEQLQVEVNKTISQITLYKDRASRLKIINPKDSGVPNEHFTNYPGIINPSSAQAASGIRYMEPPQIPADLLQILKVYEDLFYKISGEFDMEQAQGQGASVIAYKAIAALIERATTMLKGKIRNYGSMIRARGRMYLSHVLNWYDEGRWVTYDDGNGQTISRNMSGFSINVPAKLTVVSGSTMPRSSIQEREESLELFKTGAIDREELLKKLDWSNRREVVIRMNEGPVGTVIQRMQAMGIPGGVVNAVQQISQIDDKQFAAMQMKGQVPQIGQILEQSMGQQQQEPPMSPTEFADIHVKDAEIKKIEAETSLILAKVSTETANQQATGAGMQFDQSKLDIEKAKTMSFLEQSRHQRNLDKANFMHQRESHQHQQKIDLMSKFQGDTNKTTSQGPFNDHTLLSDNKEKPA